MPRHSAAPSGAAHTAAFLRPFGSIGFYFVAGFFFLTGYGLSAQFAERAASSISKALGGGSFAKSACPMRQPPAFTPLLRPFRKAHLPLEILSSQLLETHFCPFSWYALSALLLLPTFGFCLRIAKKRASALLLLAFSFLGYALFCIRLEGPWWYLSCPPSLPGRILPRQAAQHAAFSPLGRGCSASF